MTTDLTFENLCAVVFGTRGRAAPGNSQKSAHYHRIWLQTWLLRICAQSYSAHEAAPHLWILKSQHTTIEYDNRPDLREFCAQSCSAHEAAHERPLFLKWHDSCWHIVNEVSFKTHSIHVFLDILSCIYIHIYIYMYVYVFIYVEVYIHIYIYIYICMDIYVINMYMNICEPIAFCKRDL